LKDANNIALGSISDKHVGLSKGKEILELNADSTSSSSPSPMAIRCWAKFFANMDDNLPTVTIPAEWVNFFTLLMLKQGSYDWAKDFLTSEAWSLLQSYSGNHNLFSFSLPPKKPSVVISDISCSSLESLQADVDAGIPNPASPWISSASGDQEFSEEQATPPPSSTVCKTPPKGKRGKRVPISEADLRRSSRLHNQHKGFKSSICKDRNCLGCSPNPPVLSPSVVRDLGVSFCSVDPAKLTDDKLHAKAQKGAIGKSKKLKLTMDPEVGTSKQTKPTSKKSSKSSKTDCDNSPRAGSSRGPTN
jgi:hypothetical protein